MVEMVYEFGGGKVKECLGGIYEFLEKKKMESLHELEASTPAKQLSKSPTGKEQSAGKNEQKPKNEPKTAAEATPAEQRKLSYAEQRERQKQLKRLQKKVEEAEAEIARLEGVIAEIEQKLADGATDPDLYTQHANSTKQLENAMSLWELASMDVDAFNAN